MALLRTIPPFPEPHDHCNNYRNPASELENLEDRQVPAPVHQPFQSPLSLAEDLRPSRMLYPPHAPSIGFRIFCYELFLKPKAVSPHSRARSCAPMYTSARS